MTLKTQLWELIRAGFSGIWIESHETVEAIAEITALAREQDLKLVRWNLDIGLTGSSDELDSANPRDPLSAVRYLGSLTGDDTTLLVLENFHRFVDSAEVCQVLLSQLQLGKQLGRHIIVISPIVRLPAELERQFAVLHHSLPSREQLLEIATSLVGDDRSAFPAERVGPLMDAAVGLTRAEAESAFSLSLVRHGSLSASEIWDLKAHWLRKHGHLSLYRGELGFGTLGGLSSLKEFCVKSLTRQPRGQEKVLAKGVLLLGVPGTGKSAFAKSLGNETNRPVLCLDIGQLMGSLVGQTEQNIRQALSTADAMAPCILFVDEVEKALSGVSSSGKGDGGVSSRLFGTLLTWLNDHESDVYVVMTCNNIQQLPPEFSRAERFDAIMFLDLPGREEKDAIWRIYRREFRIGDDQHAPNDTSWTGAEIKACCRLSALLGVSLNEAAGFIVPVGVTAAEDIQRLRNWASERCLDASRPGIYRIPATVSERAVKPARRVRGYRPSDN
ncbi:MAG: AAA family ATPase [Pirellulales bacterium]